MSVFIIGGDRLGSITENLKQYGVTEIKHITGRKKATLSLICRTIWT